MDAALDAASTVAMTAAVTVYNGAAAVVSAVASPAAVSMLIVAAGLAWLSGIELDELNRQGTKPDIQIH